MLWTFSSRGLSHLWDRVGRLLLQCFWPGLSYGWVCYWIDCGISEPQATVGQATSFNSRLQRVTVPHARIDGVVDEDCSLESRVDQSGVSADSMWNGLMCAPTSPIAFRGDGAYLYRNRRVKFLRVVVNHEDASTTLEALKAALSCASTMARVRAV